MAVRRDVVSLSQLLQRRNGVRREGSVSLSQVSSSDSNTRGASSSASTAAKRAATAAPASSFSSSADWGPFKDARPPRDEFHGLEPRQQARLQPRKSTERSGLQGFQSLLPSQFSQSQTDVGGMRMLSQSEEAPDDSWNGYMTSQSQSQTFASQPLYQARQPSIDIAYSQPQPFTHNDKYSRMVYDSGKPSMESSYERGRHEEDTMSRLVAPVTSSLGEMKAMLYEQNAQHCERRAADKRIRDDVRSLKDTVESLHDHAKNTKQDCKNCHEKILKEVAATKCTFESMGTRIGAMEKNVDSFISNMSRFVREELFALHVEREQKITTQLPPPSKRGPRPATKRRLVEETPTSRCYARIPTSTTSKRTERGRTQSARGGSSTTRDKTGSRRRSLRLEQLHAKQEAKVVIEDDDDGQFGMQLALERVEEARAKRLQQL